MTETTLTQEELTNLSQSTLISLAKGGDAAAIEELFRRYWWEAHCVALRIVRSHEDAEDVAQDSLWSALRHLSSFREEASFRSWLHRIVINHSLMLLRRRKATGSQEAMPVDEVLDLASAWRTPEELLRDKECHELVTEGMSRLHNRYSTVLHLFAGEGRSIYEIADSEGLSISAVKSRLHRGRALLRRAVGRRLRAPLSAAEDSLAA
ncbi:MAG: sigma-70 family RNA polymerase sigma factor [Bryobacteraceae bacterium]|nr:sigma-70 family RNA polymerase sigma factor [Bryobacteraceae bacterium]